MMRRAQRRGCLLQAMSRMRARVLKAIKNGCCAHAHRHVLTSMRCMAGTLPSSWGAGGSFPVLSNLTLANNNLSGSVPLSWGTQSQRTPRFKNLQGLVLLPGALHSVVPVMRAAQALMLRHLVRQASADGSHTMRAGCSTHGDGVCSGGGRRLHCKPG
jgi:hypothetical protein